MTTFYSCLPTNERQWVWRAIYANAFLPSHAITIVDAVGSNKYIAIVPSVHLYNHRAISTVSLY